MRRTAVVAAALATLVATLQLAVPASAPALVLPPAFQLVDYPTGQAPDNLTDFAWLDDGGLITIGKRRHHHLRAARWHATRGGPQSPSVRARGDHGLLGFALGNDYATSGRVYLTYDKGDPAGTGFGMVEEWTASPPGEPHELHLVDDGPRRQPHLTPARTAQPLPRHGHGRWWRPTTPCSSASATTREQR